jgi:hypothetical protein
MAMNNTEAARDFNWRLEMSLEQILEGIAEHAHRHPDWLTLSRA